MPEPSPRCKRPGRVFFGAFRPPLVMGRWFTAEESLCRTAGYIVVLSYNFWTQRLDSRSERARQEHHAVRQSVHGRRRRRSRVRRPRFRPRAGDLGAVPARSEHDRTKATTSRRSARLQAWRHARAGAGAARWRRRRRIRERLHGGRDAARQPASARSRCRRRSCARRARRCSSRSAPSASCC